MSKQIVRAQAGQQIVFLWKYNGMECPFIHLTDPKLIKSFSDYCLVQEDLKFSRECFGLLKSTNPKNHTIQNSILANAVVTYGRPFTKAEARNVTLDANAVFANSGPCKNAHDWIMKLRHRFFAHAGGTEYEAILVYLALHPDGKSGPLEVYRGLVRASSFDGQQSVEAIAAIDHAIAWVNQKMDATLCRIKEQLASQDKASLYQQAISPESYGADTLRVFVN